MRQISAYIIAGLIGGLVSFALIKHQLKTEIFITETEAPVVRTSAGYSAALPPSFVKASNMGTKAVVQIKSSESVAAAKLKRQERQRRSPQTGWDFNFDDLFGGGGMGFMPREGSGSGVIISEDGLIVTNNHVVGFADDLEVTMSDGRTFKAAKIGTDKSTDLALIQIEGSGFPSLQFGDSDDVQVGEWVLAVGNPLGYLTSTVTAGIVSAIGRDINVIKSEVDRADKSIEEFIQTDAVVNPGNSGGALVDTDGSLIGINTAIASRTGSYTGYSFAIPANLASQIVNEILENGGDIERANLGLMVADINEMRKDNEAVGSDADYGIYITEVISGSSAQYAGILPGDVIVNINGAEVMSYDDLKESLKFVKVGDTVRVKVDRNGKRETIPVKIRNSG